MQLPPLKQQQRLGAFLRAPHLPMQDPCKTHARCLPTHASVTDHTARGEMGPQAGGRAHHRRTPMARPSRTQHLGRYTNAWALRFRAPPPAARRAVCVCVWGGGGGRGTHTAPSGNSMRPCPWRTCCLKSPWYTPPPRARYSPSPACRAAPHHARAGSETSSPMPCAVRMQVRSGAAGAQKNIAMHLGRHMGGGT